MALVSTAVMLGFTGFQCFLLVSTYFLKSPIILTTYVVIKVICVAVLNTIANSIYSSVSTASSTPVTFLALAWVTLGPSK